MKKVYNICINGSVVRQEEDAKKAHQLYEETLRICTPTLATVALVWNPTGEMIAWRL